MSRWILPFALLAVLVAPAEAPAQQDTDSDPGKSLAGNWEVSTPDRERRCTVGFLDAAPSATAGKLTLGPACDAVFPALPDAASWRLDPSLGLLLLDARGQTIIEFTEVEAGTYEGERRGDGIFFLQTVEVATAGWYTAEQIAGDWGFVAESAGAKATPLCLVTLSRSPAGPNAYRVIVKQGCDRAVATFAPAAWRIERAELTMAGDDDVWRFEEVDPTTWRRIPPVGGGMLLVRQGAP